MCSFLCFFFQKKIVFLLSKKKKFFLKKFFKNFFLLSFTSNLLSFTTFYSVLPRLVLSFTKYPRQYPALLPMGQDHVVLRALEQWGQVLTPLQLQCATQNARNVTSPSKQFVQETIQRLYTASAYLSKDTQTPIIDDDTITRAIDTHNTQYTRKYPWMCPAVFQQVNAKLRKMGLQGGVWDKEPCRVHATCSVHMQRQLAELTVTDPNFQIIGVQHSPQGAKAFVIKETLQSAARKGVLAMAHSVGLWPKCLLTETDIESGLPTLSSKCAAPSAFHLLKWKKVEHVHDWHFRLAVTHAGHPLHRISRQIGRCPTVLLKESHIASPFWGCPSMMGVRDIWTHLHTNPPRFLHAWERDIDNAYWNRNKRQVADAMRKAADTIKKHRRMHNTFCFSIAKGGMRPLDRVGHAADRNFRVYTIQNVLDFVNWDLNDNTLFTLWGIVMRQAKKGVPIGGYLSAHVYLGTYSRDDLPGEPE